MISRWKLIFLPFFLTTWSHIIASGSQASQNLLLLLLHQKRPTKFTSRISIRTKLCIVYPSLRILSIQKATQSRAHLTMALGKTFLQKQTPQRISLKYKIPPSANKISNKHLIRAITSSSIRCAMLLQTTINSKALPLSPTMANHNHSHNSSSQCRSDRNIQITPLQNQSFL